MAIIVRLVLGIALAVAAVILAVAVLKLVVVLALLGAVGFGALYAYHFLRAFARRPPGDARPLSVAGRVMVVTERRPAVI
jgi:hypothetical protein